MDGNSQEQERPALSLVEFLKDFDFEKDPFLVQQEIEESERLIAEASDFRFGSPTSILRQNLHLVEYRQTTKAYLKAKQPGIHITEPDDDGKSDINDVHYFTEDVALLVKYVKL